MGLIIKFWKNFKTQPEIWFFYGFLLTFTLTVRKVLWFLPLRGEFNEYSGVYLYLSDIFLGLTMLAWIITILYNKIDILSILKDVPRGTLVAPLVLIIWSFISLIWAENKFVSIFRSVKILEFYLLYVFILIRFFHWNVPRGTIFKKIFGLIMIIGLFQALIGIIQAILQHSIGLFWLKESLINQNIDGVAKIIFNGETFIRAYGLFPHPNILGGFLLFSIFLSLLYYKMFFAEQYIQEKNVPRGTFFKVLLGIQILALILTFSKSSILGLFLGLIYYVYGNVPRGTFSIFVRKKKRLIIASCLIIIFSFIIAKPDLYSFLFKGLNERLVYVNVSRGTIWNNPILGIGSGQFVLSMENLPVIVENWMLEPVHNVFMLVWSELGLVGFLILILFILCVMRMFHICPVAKKYSTPVEMFHVEHSMGQAWNISNGVEQLDKQKGTIRMAKTFQAISIGLLFIIFFDHYLWDIQQGNFLLWMTMGFLVGASKNEDTI
jgi:hypothetical protein